MQRRGVLILSVLCALGWMGCDDSSDEDARTSCVSATFAPRCADTAQLIVCANGYEMTMHCGTNATCADGKCLPTSACTEGEKKCSDDAGSLMTCTGGVWKSEACPSGSTCASNACVPTSACTEGEKKCSDDAGSLLTCTGGVWKSEACPSGSTCASNACVPTSACTEGEKKCSDDAGSLMTCTGGAWVPSVCAHGCDGGQCLVATDTCNTEGGRKCNADSTGTLVCQGGVWVPTDDLCHYGCTSGRCDEKVEEPCEKGTYRCSGPTIESCTDGNWHATTRQCEFGCKNGECLPEPQPVNGIMTCEFTTLDNDEDAKSVRGNVRVIVDPEYDYTKLEGVLACGQKTAYTYSWSLKSPSAFVECPDCVENESSLVADLSYAAMASGTYGCVFKVHISGLAQTSYYLCPIEYGPPMEESVAPQSYMRDLTVAPKTFDQAVLARWTFAKFTKNEKISAVAPDSGELASQATLRLSDGSELNMLTGTGGYPEAAASAANWSTESALKYDAKHFVIDLPTTGYKNIHITFNVAGSGIFEKSVAVVSHIQDIDSIVGAPLTFDTNNEFVEFASTAVPNADNLNALQIRIYPYGVSDQNATIRIDDITITGDLSGSGL